MSDDLWETERKLQSLIDAERKQWLRISKQDMFPRVFVPDASATATC